MTIADQQDTSLIADLRRQLDRALERHGDLERLARVAGERCGQLEAALAGAGAELAQLRTRMLGEAELAQLDNEMPEKRGSSWWFTAWREGNRDRAALRLRIATLERWLGDAGVDPATGARKP